MPIEPMLSEEMPANALVARVLEEAGIEMVFGISGGHTGRIVSGLSKYQNSIRTVLVREESLGGVMAEVYGRLTRRPGVLLGQGPWVLGNGLIGTIEAYLSSSPMLLLTDFSDAPRFPLHAPYQQGTGDWGSWDARRAFGGVTKHVMQAHDPIAAVQATQLGIKHALAGQPGPVAILYSHDSLAGSVAPDLQPMLYPTRYYLPGLPPPAEQRQIEAAAAAILGAQKPVLISGNGVRIARAYDELCQLAEAAGLPVATTAAGKGTFAETHPLALGVFGTFGTEAANACIAEADLVVVAGSKLSPSDTAWENRDLLDPTRQIFRPDRHRAPQRLVELSGRACAARRCRGDPRPARRRTSATRNRATAGGRTARRRPSRASRVFQQPRLFRRRCTDPAAAADRGIAARTAGKCDRDL